MTSHWKVFGLILSTRYIEDHDIPGDIVECGVWRGGSMQAAALTLMESGSSERQLHLFDTFEGMPPPSEYDSSGGLSAEVLLSQASREDRIWAVASLEDVRAGMAETGYPTERIHYHVGQVEQTVPSEPLTRSQSSAWTPTGTSQQSTNWSTSTTGCLPVVCSSSMTTATGTALEKRLTSGSRRREPNCCSSPCTAAASP